MLKYKLIFFAIFILSMSLFAKNPVRIKDIAVIQGIRDNQLTGIGLVTGLQGRGDSREFKLTQKMLLNLMTNYGFDLKQEDIKSKNVACVLVTANIGPFVRGGDIVDVSISSIGDSKSLSGGILLQTALKAADGNVYAVAQGRIISGTKDQNSETSASIPQGAIVEKDVVSTFTDGEKINISLKIADFTTANLIREAVLSLNQDLKITAVDAGLVEIILGEEEKKNIVDFISKLEVLTVTPDNIAMVIIDKKTGVIVAGGDVIIQECTVSTPQAQVKISTQNKEKKYTFELKSQTIGELVNILNEAGLQVGEIIALIESVYKVGAINAKLILL
ncbi:MAG: hypothetical protein A2086_08545 [Spirochaetes bacterium GWD1_27_9]|nr:MAG: hypothetical protein A2Z98_02340 [Spirochaetes bacterium GWB1_27_13]OHD23322.1 MAG: hypothetical protein A2Y34_11660 [Spirochaetes bacterium GWC1_27_15]OHD44394.1 MAG: hypothetical protein A2086_08545 [Spirochaetes bacterium GWD1_27_9]